MDLQKNSSVNSDKEYVYFAYDISLSYNIIFSQMHLQRIVNEILNGFILNGIFSVHKSIIFNSHSGHKGIKIGL